MNFLVDQPLGGLAKWLRFCGFDATLMRLALDTPGSWPPPRPRTHILTRQAAAHRLKRPDLMVLAAPDSAGQLHLTRQAAAHRLKRPTYVLAARRGQLRKCSSVWASRPATSSP